MFMCSVNLSSVLNLDLFWKQSKTGYYLTVRELVSAPLELASEFQSRLGARTMLRLEAVIRFCSEFFETKFKNLKKTGK
jgi:hypothetical protein